ncbi:hypothetical protein MXAN_1423 [Myxococcus xanthus DK 1622]|uniref:Tetratricopeptide repeat protein n=1 Tax=Myxococcus xanthus (strain DK1622) TaxID=246197 RepID=Q1DCE3_MYXXD|nr:MULTISPECIES: hypothetical protein [Myxococcus]ABF86086.1 hypothetical protein MXAN_1423 [Myxococcus xanthus DK 1622]NOJ55775.1 hypothetical protein [Myxococcus xanthus]QPM81061.1 hypothetical protein I5Q59_07100 [Myxococcus xanthus]QVW70120.1 hypothetical protein JTM82_11390 [Myxococcus xanthus DZ2]QZZ48954.1 hypothetical protein MyxoNM_07045 [Myxococcus xanthus]
MGGVRNGKSAGTPEPAAVRQAALQPGASDIKPAEDVSEVVDRHFRSAARQLREGSAARAFGELARASRTLPMTPRLAAGIVRMALLAGTEAAAITLLEVAPTVVSSRRAVRRQLARVLRRVDQLPRAAAALEALLVEWPEDRRARRVLQVLRARIGGKAVPDAGASAPKVDEDEEGVLAKLPARREGAQAAASWENDDAVYLIETVVGPPLSARAVSASASTVGAVEARSRSSVSQFPAVGGGAPAAVSPARGADGLQAEAPPVSEQRGPVSISVPPPGADVSATASSKGGEALPDTDARPPPVKAPPTESLKTVLEMPAVELPAVTPRGTSASEAPRTVVEMPAVVVPPGASDFEARKTEVEMPALGDVAMPPSSGVAKTFVPGRAPLPVPWADAPDDDAVAPAPVARFDDADESEVTSEAQPFLVGADVSSPPPRQQTPASSKSERRKTPPPSEALPPRITSSAAPEPDARSGTMEVSLAELEAALASASGDASNKKGRASEASAGPREEDTEELTRSQKVEAQLIARRAWAELAQLYLKRADRAKDASLRADALARLAEVMENELHDPAGAARMYREIVELTGDRAALRDQVRLLAARGDASLVRRALDEAIRRAPAGRARAGALLTRGERWLHMGELKKARADFEAAESSAPGLLPVLAGMLRCVSDAERPSIAERLRVALAAAPRRALDRVEALRVLAQVAEESLSDWRLAQWAWSEVLTESPDSEQARVQLTTLTRKLGDTTVLSRLLRAQLARESRGPAARQARLELVATLDAQGDADAALEELRQAVRYEPGHKEAWLMLVERLLARDLLGEAAWALEHAATAMDDEAERERTWDRLARLWREVMGNPERAQVYARRAEGIRQARAEREVPPPEPPRSAAPRRESSGPRAPLIAAPPVLTQSSGNLQSLANEDASTTDIGVAPSASESVEPTRDEVGRNAPGAAVEQGRKASPEPVPSSGRKGRREARSDADAPLPKGAARATVSPAQGEPRVPSEAFAASPPKAEARAAASSPRGEARNPPSSPGNTAAPPPRAPAESADAAVAPKAPAAQRAPAPSRGDKAAPRAAASGSEVEQGPASRDAEARAQRPRATDLITGEVMDLGDAPVPETRVISWEAPPGRMDPVRRVVRARPEGTVSAPAPGRTFIAKPPAAPEPPRPVPGVTDPRESPAPAYVPSPDTEPDAFRHIRERPLDAKPYRLLAEYFDQRGDPARASLMREIANALDGLETPAPRGQRPPLTSDERAGLRHPGLRTPSGELLACTGIALCRLFPAEGRAAGSSELMRATAGPCAPAVLDALHTAARMLDVHLPELVLAEDDGPPFTAVHAGHPRLLVGRLLLREPMPLPELRFHVGRALLSLSPDLLALRALKGGQLLRALALLATVLKDPRASGAEARVVRESLSPRALERAMALLEPGTQNFKASALADAARDSANRAGLVACGSIGPALSVLRTRRGNEAELVELLRFAASERYLPLRAPR